MLSGFKMLLLLRTVLEKICDVFGKVFWSFFFLYSKYIFADSCKMLPVEFFFNTVYVVIKIADYICSY